MRVAIIGRSEWLYETALLLKKKGYEIPLIITANEAPEYKVTANDYEALASKWGAVFIKTGRINEPKYYEQIRSLEKIDLAVSVNYSGIIAQSVIDLFPLGILNAHGGDLPRYRGNACQAWAIINGESKIGLCIHKMIGGELDSGKIIARDYYPLTNDTRVGEVFAWMEKKLPLLVLDAVRALNDDPLFYLEEQSKDPADALHCYPRRPSDGRLDWTKDSLSVLRLINASSEPFAGAYSYVDDKCVRIWRASVYNDQEKYLAVPGQVAKIASDGTVVVVTGDGKIRIREISFEEKGQRGLPASIIKSTRQRFT